MSRVKKKPSRTIEHRYYDLPLDVPAILLTGDDWTISDIISGSLHFHNCTEIGFCHGGRGFIEFETGQKLPFEASDILIIPRNVSHTTYSLKDEPSLWSYIFLDFAKLFSRIPYSPLTGSYQTPDEQIPDVYLYKQSTDRHIHFLATCLLDEIKSKKDDWALVFSSTALLLKFKLAN